MVLTPIGLPLSHYKVKVASWFEIVLFVMLFLIQNVSPKIDLGGTCYSVFWHSITPQHSQLSLLWQLLFVWLQISNPIFMICCFKIICMKPCPVEKLHWFPVLQWNREWLCPIVLLLGIGLLDWLVRLVCKDGKRYKEYKYNQKGIHTRWDSRLRGSKTYPSTYSDMLRFVQPMNTHKYLSSFSELAKTQTCPVK